VVPPLQIVHESMTSFYICSGGSATSASGDIPVCLQNLHRIRRETLLVPSLFVYLLKWRSRFWTDPCLDFQGDAGFIPR
jgi:hypothetical protein